MTTPAPDAEAKSTAADAPSPAADAPGFGWTTYAERINGRFAMVGFVALLVLELVTHQTFFTWLGF
ncbi:MAG: chlorophyll a/b-binding protein [Spirulina sp.]